MTMDTTYDLITADNIIPAIQNYYNWSELYRQAPTFSTFNNLGMLQVDATPTGGKGNGNYKVDFNKLTGMKTKYLITADILDTAGDINLMEVGDVSTIDTSTGLALLNVTARVGLGLRFIGTATGGTINGGAATAINALFRLNVVTGAANWSLELLQSNLEGEAGADDFDTIDINSYCYITDIAEFGGEAPTADDMNTTQDSNYLQMYDVAYGKNMVAMSQNAKYDNTNAENALAVQTRMFNSINTDLWFGLLNTAGNGPRDGFDYGTMAGMWGMFNLEDTSANTDPSSIVAQVDTGTDVDFDTLELALSARTYGSDQLLCFGSRKMSSKLAQAARLVNETVRTETVMFPRCAIQKRIIHVGDVTLNFISDDTLLNHPVFNDGTNTAGQGLMFVALDASKAGLFYHQNEKLGLMTPKTEPVLNSRNKRVDEYHMLAALTCGVWDKAAHFAYGITGS